MRNRTAPDATLRAGTMELPMTTVSPAVGRPGRQGQDAATNNTPTATKGAHRNRTRDIAGANTMAIPIGRASNHHHHHHRDSDSGPYRDEDVLLSLQLLAYLSKYPHVCQTFYKSRTNFILLALTSLVLVRDSNVPWDRAMLACHVRPPHY